MRFLGIFSYKIGMDDATTLMHEMRRCHEEGERLRALLESTSKQAEVNRERKRLLGNTWRILYTNEGMTLVQAKMIAHEEDEDKKASTKYNISWTGDVVVRNKNASRWTKILRRLYFLLGGK